MSAPLPETLPETLGPTTARNWGWAVLLGAGAVLCAASALEATLRLGAGWTETALPLLVGAPLAAGAHWVWRLPPFERTVLRVDAGGVEVAGRRAQVRLAWAEIAAITLRPASMGPAYMTLERAAPGQEADAEEPQTAVGFLAARDAGVDDAPGVMFPVRAVGVSAEEIAAVLARGAEAAGYRMEEPGRGDGRAVHRFGGPRRWILMRD
ncbi:MAG: hypothetical protein AAGB05_12510 [Pseudomonadota bacterium]